jgi:hypothetical protein
VTRPEHTYVDQRLVNTLLLKYDPSYHRLRPDAARSARMELLQAWRAQDEVASLWDFTRERHGWNDGEYS